jgi:hypothetical protein
MLTSLFFTLQTVFPEAFFLQSGEDFVKQFEHPGVCFSALVSTFLVGIGVSEREESLDSRSSGKTTQELEDRVGDIERVIESLNDSEQSLEFVQLVWISGVLWNSSNSVNRGSKKLSDGLPTIMLFPQHPSYRSPAIFIVVELIDSDLLTYSRNSLYSISKIFNMWKKAYYSIVCPILISFSPYEKIYPYAMTIY